MYPGASAKWKRAEVQHSKESKGANHSEIMEYMFAFTDNIQKVQAHMWHERRDIVSHCIFTGAQQSQSTIFFRTDSFFIHFSFLYFCNFTKAHF